MLARAKEKNVYDALVQGELTEYLRSSREAFDLIVSADTLVYFGALEDVVAAAAGALRPHGLLIFTLEHAARGDATLDYRLELHGRYSHCPRVCRTATRRRRTGVRRLRTPSCGWNREHRLRGW